ncbi:penicillin-binding protein 2 [Synechococcus sp. RSCCF101]|uniref:peptidoglycan D,D-transpeptidase FtsI family protein n=1 Tax=Synechococcus sp. RSCCF101 TaxID=2511069 RepID=UPI00124871F4|nr:penicillin-binding protein 2 [Synechococcus sp. RSCCF101]QEY31378.1 penicillin-binding protein 2 [Synechococcus sp. RSCCF101]
MTVGLSRAQRPRSGGRVLQLKPVPGGRLIAVYTLMALGLVGLGVRLAWLQLRQADSLEERARSIQTQTTEPLGQRRSIVDRSGRLVALDEQRYTLWAHPYYFSFAGDDPGGRRSTEEVAARLAEVLAEPAEALIAEMGEQPTGIRLATDLTPERADAIRRLGISGLDLEAYAQRVYPQGPLFANVVGFLNLNRDPQAGLEQSRDGDLRRHELTRRVRRGADGTPLPAAMAPGTLWSDDLQLQLTLDARLQELTAKALAAQVSKWKAKRGAAMVMDVNSGALLALTSTPTYDPNRFWEFETALFREWSVQDLYEPGSTFKPINLAIALQEQAIDPNGTVNDTGLLQIGGWPIYNHDRQGNGVIDYPTVLQVSSNVAMVKAMNRMEPALFWSWLDRLGIDERPDTDLPGAAAGWLKTRTQFVDQPIEPATAAFGQGLSMTPLKLAQLHAMLANGGRLVSPHITRGLRAGDGLAPSDAPDGVQVLDPSVTATVMDWLETVVDKGSGKGVKIPGYRIGGKTGTAQKAENGRYIPGARITSFVAHLPIDDPRYVVLVVVDEPQGGNAYGSTVAVPVARSIIEALLVLEKIPPSSGAPASPAG